MIIVIMLSCLFIFSIIVSFIYVKLMVRKHKDRLKLHKDRFKKQNHSEEEEISFDFLLEKELNYIRNYIIFQIVGKLCEMLSILFSVTSFSFTFISEENAWFSVGKQVIPLLSVVMIIVVIYVVPSKRWAEYLQAWREIDYLTCNILEKNISQKDLPDELKRIEEGITSDKN